MLFFFSHRPRLALGVTSGHTVRHRRGRAGLRVTPSFCDPLAALDAARRGSTWRRDRYRPKSRVARPWVAAPERAVLAHGRKNGAISATHAVAVAAPA